MLDGREFLAPLSGELAVDSHDGSDRNESAQCLTDEVLGVVLSILSIELVATVHVDTKPCSANVSTIRGRLNETPMWSDGSVKSSKN